MIKKITVSFKGFEEEIQALSRFGSKLLPNTFKAFTEIGDKMVSALKRVSDSKIHRRSNEYVSKWQESLQYPYDGDPFRLHLENDLPYAMAIEEGSKAYDQLDGFMRSKKARLAKKGGTYLIIPFKIGTPGTVSLGEPMPKDIHSVVAAKSFQYSKRLDRIIFERNQYNQPVARSTYAWGSRYTAGENQRFHIPKGKDWASGRYEGMVKTNKPGGGHGGYMTFRVASNKSRQRNPMAWMMPAQEGKHIAETALNEMRPYVETSLRDAVMKDLEVGR